MSTYERIIDTYMGVGRTQQDRVYRIVEDAVDIDIRSQVSHEARDSLLHATMGARFLVRFAMEDMETQDLPLLTVVSALRSLGCS